MKPVFFFLSLLLLNLQFLLAQNQRTAEVFFEQDKSELSAAAFAELQQLIESIDRSAPYRIEVLGHTDNKGGHIYNRTLSDERAKVVLQAFQEAGLDEEKIVALPMGETRPAFSNDTEEGRLRNRRVEIYLTYTSQQPQMATQQHIPLKHEVKIDPILKPFAQVPPYKTIVSNQGTKVEVIGNIFAPYSLDEVDIRIEEVYSPLQALQHNRCLETRTIAGDFLASAGMLRVDARVDGKKVYPQGKGKIMAWIPTQKFVDGMELFRAVNDGNGCAIWEASENADILTKTVDGKTFYKFNIVGHFSTWINLDVIIKTDGDEDAGTIAPPMYVKVKSVKKAKLFGQYWVAEGFGVIKADQVKRRKFELLVPASQEEVMIYAKAKKAGHQSMLNMSLSNLKYRPKQNIYVIRRKDFKPVELPTYYTEVLRDKNYHSLISSLP